ncbi:MAG: hypothetical protein R2788_19675 [Saprospiraceae bacterium]
MACQTSTSATRPLKMVGPIDLKGMFFTKEFSNNDFLVSTFFNRSTAGVKAGRSTWKRIVLQTAKTKSENRLVHLFGFKSIVNDEVHGKYSLFTIYHSPFFQLIVYHIP